MLYYNVHIKNTMGRYVDDDSDTSNGNHNVMMEWLPTIATGSLSQKESPLIPAKNGAPHFPVISTGVVILYNSVLTPLSQVCIFPLEAY